MPAQSGAMGVPGETRVTRGARERAARTARRRWLVLFAVVLLVVAAIVANIKPLTHFQDASARLDKATAKVDGLMQQKAQLQNQLARLNEAGYLETLARQQMTYVRPGEDLYIVTGADTAGTTPAATSQGMGAGMAGAPASANQAGGPTTTGPAGQGGGQTGGQTGGQDAGQATTEKPGFFERAISAIRGLF